MRIGGEDGKNEIYDDEGKLIKKKDEKLMLSKKDVYCEVTEEGLRGRLFGKTLFSWGKGRLYTTDKRLVVIRRPIETHVVLVNSPGLHMPTTVSVRKKTEAGGIREYVQIKLKEIENWRTGLFGKHRFTVVDRDKNKYSVGLKVVSS